MNNTGRPKILLPCLMAATAIVSLTLLPAQRCSADASNQPAARAVADLKLLAGEISSYRLKHNGLYPKELLELRENFPNKEEFSKFLDALKNPDASESVYSPEYIKSVSE